MYSLQKRCIVSVKLARGLNSLIENETTQTEG
jgi:hypothetical protein